HDDALRLPRRLAARVLVGERAQLADGAVELLVAEAGPRPAARLVPARVPDLVEDHRIGRALALVHQIEVAAVDAVELHRPGHDLDREVAADTAELLLHRLADRAVMQHGPADAQRRAVGDAGHAPRLADRLALDDAPPRFVEQLARAIRVG